MCDGSNLSYSKPTRLTIGTLSWGVDCLSNSERHVSREEFNDLKGLSQGNLFRQSKRIYVHKILLFDVQLCVYIQHYMQGHNYAETFMSKCFVNLFEEKTIIYN